jgi:hypothetical protein
MKVTPFKLQTGTPLGSGDVALLTSPQTTEAFEPCDPSR